MKINCQSSLSWFHTEISEQKNYDPNLYDIFFDVQATSNFERHFIAELIIALKCLSKKDKALFSGTSFFTTPWVRPSPELLKDIACKYRVSKSYVEQRFYSINAEISERMRSRGFMYIPAKKKKPAPKLQSLEDFFDFADGDDVKENLSEKKSHPKFDKSGKPIYDLSGIKPKRPTIASLNEDELFSRLSFECERRHVPPELISRLMMVVMVYLKTNYFKPLLLCGSAGVGKTYLAKVLSDVLDLPLHMISAPASGTSRGLSGDSRTYTSSAPGAIVQALHRFKVLNPIILVDEIDKASSRRDAVHNLSDELLSCLDGTRQIYDNYQQDFISTKDIPFILTANEINHVPLWLKDRCEVINFPDPTQDRLHAIVNDYVIDKMKSEIYNGRIVFSNMMIEKLVYHMYSEGQISIRQYLAAVDKIFDDAYFRMLSEHLPNVLISEKIISEALKSRSANGKRHYGFSL